MIVLAGAIKPTFNRLETSAGFLSDDDHIYPKMIVTCPENFTLSHPLKRRNQKYQQKIEKIKWTLNHQECSYRSRKYVNKAKKTFCCCFSKTPPALTWKINTCGGDCLLWQIPLDFCSPVEKQSRCSKFLHGPRPFRSCHVSLWHSGNCVTMCDNVAVGGLVIAQVVALVTLLC